MLALFSKAVGYIAGVFAVAKFIVISEVGEAAASAKLCYDLARDCDWTSDAEVGAVVDSGIFALKEAADVTESQVDDEIVESLSNVATINRAWLIEAIQWCVNGSESPHETPREKIFSFAAMKAPPASGDNAAANPVMWIELAVLLWSLIKPFVRK